MDILWRVLFVFGVWFMAISAWGAAPTLNLSRAAWLLWAIAALIWLFSGYDGGAGLGFHHVASCSRLFGC